MKNIIEYLKQTLDKTAEVTQFNVNEKLSLYLSSSYCFFKVTVLNEEFLLVESLENRTIAQLKKQLANMEERLECKVVLLTGALSPYKRKRLIEEHIAFISRERQMFLPFMGIHLKDSYKKKTLVKKVEKFTPLMQLIFLKILYGSEKGITQTGLADELKISHMSVSRTLEQFVRWRLLEYVVEGETGRKKVYSYIDKKTFYQEGIPYFTNPVKDSFYVEHVSEEIRTYVSGLSALSEKTMLGGPGHRILAISPRDEKIVRAYQVPDEKGIEEKCTEVQIMKYDICVLTEDAYLDPVSILHSITERDERIEMAIDEMMEEYTWYEE